MNISIDEFLWKFRGRLSFRTYNPSKRARFEVEVYRLSASDGVVAGSVFRIYTGKQKGDMPSSQKAVMDLMQAEGFFHKGYTVFMNNWYTSPVLLHYLQGRKTGAVGTAKTNRRHMPKYLKPVQRGEVDFRSSRSGMMKHETRNNAEHCPEIKNGTDTPGLAPDEAPVLLSIMQG